MIVQDNRTLTLYRIVSSNGDLNLSNGVEIRQGSDGMLQGSGIWFDILVPNPSDILFAANDRHISALEWFKQKIEVIPYIKAEIG